MSIGKKITSFVIFISLLIVLPAGGLYFWSELKQETAMLHSFGRNIGIATEASLTNYMLTRDSTLLDETIRTMKKIEPISGIWLVDNKGTVASSSIDGFVGTKMPAALKYREGGAGGYALADEKTFRWVHPVKNKPLCSGCHGAKEEHLGVIVVDFSTEGMLAQVKQEALRGFAIFIPALLLVGVFIILISRSFIIERTRSLIAKVKGIKEGDYGDIIPLKKNDEISELEQAFNTMTLTLKERDQEKDLLFGQISKSYEMWQSTFDSIADMIAIIDDGYNIVMANRAFLDYFGVSREDLTEKKCYEIFHGGVVPSVDCPHPVAMRENRPKSLELRRPGTDRILNLTIYPYRNSDLGFDGTIHIVRDVTDEKESEMRMIMSERLAALGEMASGLAHEINNPLASIAGCAEGLLTRVNKAEYDPEFFKEYLGIMEEEILRCKNITTSMLSFVRRSSVKQEADISKILDRTVNIIGLQGRLNNVEVVRDYGDVPLINANESELRQVFMAIIANALDAMKDSGTLTLKTAKGDNTVAIEIGDTGPGIPQHVIDRIFDPFFTTKTETGGTGLGLSIARKIIASNGGDIAASSAEGKGATIRITLPAAASE